MLARTLSPAPVDLDRWRRDTPGCRDRIHLNNAGAGLMPRPVLDALTDHLAREAAIGGYEAADEAEPRVRETYALVADLVGAAPRNIALVENATVAFSQALSAFDFRPGDRIVTTRTDYPSNQLMYLSLAQRAGVETVRADDLPEGGVDPESVRRLARDPRTRLVALSWVPTNSGLVQDASSVGVVCAELGVPYLVDACQSVGQMAIDVNALKCDFLAATGRKFLRGPRGVGFLYVSDRLLEPGAVPCAGGTRVAAGGRGVLPPLPPTKNRRGGGPGRGGGGVAGPDPPMSVARPGKIIGIGRNYRDHAAELGHAVPPRPLLFLKPPTTVIKDGDAIVLPAESQQVDFEGEIGVVIGRPLRRATEQQAGAAIAGITCVNDVTARDLQRAEEQWTRAKGFDTFCPVGPRVVPVDPSRFA